MTTKSLTEIFRDYETDGVPSSGAHKPIKADIRQWGSEIEGFLTNTRRAITGAYTVLTSDDGCTLALGGSAFYTLTFGPGSGYPDSFLVFVVNEDSARAKKIALSGGATFKLYPAQSMAIFSQNDIWYILPQSKRWQVPSNLTLNVNVGLGSDTTGDGLATGSGAFATPLAAYNAITSDFDVNGKTITLLGANGNLAALNMTGPWTGGGNITFDLGGQIFGGGGAALDINTPLPGTFKIQNGTIAPGAGGIALNHAGNGRLELGTGLIFGAAAFHIVTNSTGAFIFGALVPYTISAMPSAYHIAALQSGSQIWLQGAGSPSPTVVSGPGGTPTFATFAHARAGTRINMPGYTFTNFGTPTGQRYEAQGTGAIDTNGGGANYFPGSIAGSGTYYS